MTDQLTLFPEAPWRHPYSTDRQLYALITAAKKQADPVKRQRILDKIREIQTRINKLKWLAQ